MTILLSTEIDDRIDFKTHLKYTDLIVNLSHGLKISGTLTPKLSKTDVAKLQDKIKLIRLTKTSIDNENAIVSFDKEYSTASVLWLPIKTYYLMYHLLCVIECLLSGKLSSLTLKHYDCVSLFTQMLERGEIKFSNPRLNTTFDNTILNFTSKLGEHLRSNVSEDVLYQLIMKKTAKEKVNNYKIVYGLSGKKLKDKIRIKSFESNIKISIFDFFHLMRLRMNYRNLNFIDNIPASYTKMYFEKYHNSSNNFYNALSKYANELIDSTS